MEHKHYLATPIEVVDLKQRPGMAGEFSAYASTFGNKDHGGDIITKGAFSASLRARNFRPLLWQHDMREPIGIEKSIKEDSKGLLGTWELVDTQRGRDAYALLKAGAVRSMSIGYIPTKWEFEGETQDAFEVTRIIKEIDLLENSVVSIPMNDQAQVQAVKHAEHCDMCADIERVKKLEIQEELPDYSILTLAKHAKLLVACADAFGERTKDLLEKLQEGNHELTESKRTDLHALLETFSGLAAVQPTLEEVLAHQPVSSEEKSEEEKSTQSHLALSIRLRQAQRRARDLGVEV